VLHFQNATHCHICNHELETDRVRNHDHLSGEYFGAAHNACNLNYKYSGKISVFFHNLKNYDLHLIMRGVANLDDDDEIPINCIPSNSEKYISFSLGNLEFKDSLQFLNSSLEKLVENLNKEECEKFKILQKYIDDDKVDLL